jgi:hypothetical protein
MSEYPSVNEYPRYSLKSTQPPMVQPAISNTLIYVGLTIAIVLSLIAIILHLIDHYKTHQSRQTTEKEFKKWVADIIHQSPPVQIHTPKTDHPVFNVHADKETSPLK